MNNTATTTAQFDAAAKLIGKRDSKKVGNNTYLIAGTDCIHVRLHNTHVVTLHTDGRIILNSDGWQTVTTRDRMNQYLPDGVSLFQKAHVWYVWYRYSDETIEYYDGITV